MVAARCILDYFLSMAAHKGRARPKNSGRKVGTPNRATASIKGAFVAAFDKLGGSDALAAWAQDNPTDFYKLASKLIPTELTGQVKTVIEIIDPASDA